MYHFIFIIISLLYNILLVLPCINMNPPWVYTYSQNLFHTGLTTSNSSIKIASFSFCLYCDLDIFPDSVL